MVIGECSPQCHSLEMQKQIACGGNVHAVKEKRERKGEEGSTTEYHSGFFPFVAYLRIAGPASPSPGPVLHHH